MRWIIFSATIAVIGVLCHPFGFFGPYIWTPSPVCPLPTDAQFPFFAGIAIIESSAFGFGWAYLVFGYKYTKRQFLRRWQTICVHMALSWQLINWWLHDSLHMVVGTDLYGMLFIEYAFHVTLIVSACLVILCFAMRRSPVLRSVQR